MTTEEQPTDAKPQTIEEILSALPDEHKDAVLGQLSKARQEAATYRTKLREAEPLAQKARELEDAQKSTEEKAREAFEAAEKRANTYRDRAVGAEVRALASKTFADPDDALAFVNPSKYVDANGEIDSDAISSDLANLLERKPHLAAASPDVTNRRPAPDNSQGSSAAGSTPSSPADSFAQWWNATTNR